MTQGVVIHFLEAGSTDERQKSRPSVASPHGELNDAPCKSSKSCFLDPMKVTLCNPLCRHDLVKDVEKGRLLHISCIDHQHPHEK